MSVNTLKCCRFRCDGSASLHGITYDVSVNAPSAKQPYLLQQPQVSYRRSAVELHLTTGPQPVTAFLHKLQLYKQQEGFPLKKDKEDKESRGMCHG